MLLASIIVGLLVVVAFFFFARRSATNPGVPAATTGRSSSVGRKAQAKKSSKVSAPANPFRSTSIVPGTNACSAVTAIADQRYLDSEQSVPKVPLPECDVSQCDCRYARHEDRRDIDEDRRHPAGLQSELYETSGNKNRRAQKSGRRDSDWP